MTKIEEIEIQRAAFYRKYYKLMRRVIMNQMKAVSEKILESSIEEAYKAIDILIKKDVIKEVFYNLWKTVGVWFAMKEFRTINNKKSMSLKEGEEQLYTDIWEGEMLKYAEFEAGYRIVSITNTSKKVVRGLMSQLMKDVAEQGIGINEAARWLYNSLNKGISKYAFYGAKRIAMTEILGASNRGSWQGAKSTGMPMMKNWLVSPGISKKDRHVLYPELTNGQKVDRDAPFKVGGYDLMYPGDPGGPLEEIINCKCGVEYIPI